MTDIRDTFHVDRYELTRWTPMTRESCISVHDDLTRIVNGRSWPYRVEFVKDGDSTTVFMASTKPEEYPSFFAGDL